MLILFYCIYVKGKASYWAVIGDGLTGGSAHLVLSIVIIIVLRAFEAGQVSSWALILTRTRLILGPNSILKGYTASFPTISCPLYDVLNDRVFATHVYAVFRVVFTILTFITLLS